MRMYHFALFFAIIGAMSGAVDLIMTDSGGDNWFDQPVPNMEIISVSDENVSELQFDDDTGIIDTITDLPKYMNILWNVLQGIFLISTMLDDYLIWDVNGTNLFAPVLYTFNAGIIVVYIVGSVQFILGRAMKVME